MKGIGEDLYSNLLSDIAKGNQQAFTKLYDLFYPDLIRFVTAKVNDQSSAEDILHDLFLSLWKTRDRIQEIESLSAYLYSSCRYLIIGYIKRSSVWNTNQDLSDLEIKYEETSLEDRLHYRYLLDMVNLEIENLPEKCKEIFKLSREQLKSNKEIAEYLGISESTVENHINKALKRIRFARKKMFFLMSVLH